MTSTPQQQCLAHHSMQRFTSFDTAYPSPPWSDCDTTHFTVPMDDYETTHHIYPSQVVLPYPPSPVTRCCTAARDFGDHELARHYPTQRLFRDVQDLVNTPVDSAYQSLRQSQEAQVIGVDPKHELRTTMSRSPKTKRASTEGPSPSYQPLYQDQMALWHEMPTWISTVGDKSVMQPKPIHPPVVMSHLHQPEPMLQHDCGDSYHATSSNTMPAHTTSVYASPTRQSGTATPSGLLRSMKIESTTPSPEDFKQEEDEGNIVEEDTKGDIQMRRTRRTDADSASFVCTICVPPKGFSRRFNLQTHYKTHGKDRVRPFECYYDLCEKRFPRAHDRQRHIDSVHLRSKKFQCYICSRGFPRKDSLQRHQRTGCAEYRVSADPPSKKQFAPFIGNAGARRKKKVLGRAAMRRERDQDLRHSEEPQQSFMTTTSISSDEPRIGFGTLWEDLTTSGLSYYSPDFQSLSDTNQTSTTYWPAVDNAVGYSLSTHDQTLDWSQLFGAYNE